MNPYKIPHDKLQEAIQNHPDINSYYVQIKNVNNVVQRGVDRAYGVGSWTPEPVEQTYTSPPYLKPLSNLRQTYLMRRYFELVFKPLLEGVIRKANQNSLCLAGDYVVQLTEEGATYDERMDIVRYKFGWLAKGQKRTKGMSVRFTKEMAEALAVLEEMGRLVAKMPGVAENPVDMGSTRDLHDDLFEYEEGDS